MPRSRDEKHELKMSYERGWFTGACACTRWSDMAKPDEADELFAYWLAHMVKVGKIKADTISVAALDIKADPAWADTAP